MVSHPRLSGAHPVSEPTTDHHQLTKPRKQACLACRRRKKRCDSNQPACSACSGWKMECVYASGSQTPLDYGFPTPNSALEMDLAAFVQDLPTTSFDFLPELFPLPSDSNHGVLGCGEQYPDGLTPVDPFRPSSTNLSSYPTIPLPSPEQKIQLINEFFDRSHHLLPCIHRETILNRSRGSQGPVLSTPLEWAIMATAVRTTRGAMVSRADIFLKTAVDSLAQSPIIQENVLRDLQAAVWCVFSLYHSGTIVKAVVLLAQAYSLACLNGLNRLDDPNPNMLATMRFSPLEEEECRCTLWALFILDRHMNHLLGRHFVIDDTLWCVNYPLDDRSLQNGLRADPEGYDRDLAALASEKTNVPIGACLTRLLCKVSVILGRIVTYKNIKPMPTGADDAQIRLAEFHELQSALTCFWLSLPPYVYNVTEVPPENASQAFWLLIVAHTCSTILFYITEVERRSPGGASLPTERENFICTYKSVNKVVTGLRQVSGLAIDAVLNPMLAPSYFMCCRFILAQWRLSRQESYRLDLNLVLKLLGRMAQGQAQLPRIYKDLIDLEMGRDMQPGGGVLQSLLRTNYCFMI